MKILFFKNYLALLVSSGLNSRAEHVFVYTCVLFFDKLGLFGYIQIYKFCLVLRVLATTIFKLEVVFVFAYSKQGR